MGKAPRPGDYDILPAPDSSAAMTTSISSKYMYDVSKTCSIYYTILLKLTF